MAGMDDLIELPADFGGLVRLFPLPDLVVFPHAMQPLHIFEPRYCDLLAESLASDRLIAMATLRKFTAGESAAATDRQRIHPTVCIGKIVSHIETDDGRHNVLLIGAKRARVRRELSTNRSFRMAEVELADDVHPPASGGQLAELKREVLDAFAAVIPATATVHQNLHELMAGQMGLGPITDIIAYTLPLDTESKLRLLDQPHLGKRTRLLIRLLRANQAATAPGGGAPAASSPAVGQTPSRAFPPPFSIN